MQTNDVQVTNLIQSLSDPTANHLEYYDQISEYLKADQAKAPMKAELVAALIKCLTAEKEKYSAESNKLIQGGMPDPTTQEDLNKICQIIDSEIATTSLGSTTYNLAAIEFIIKQYETCLPRIEADINLANLLTPKVLEELKTDINFANLITPKALEELKIEVPKIAEGLQTAQNNVKARLARAQEVYNKTNDTIRFKKEVSDKPFILLPEPQEKNIKGSKELDRPQGDQSNDKQGTKVVNMEVAATSPALTPVAKFAFVVSQILGISCTAATTLLLVRPILNLAVKYTPQKIAAQILRHPIAAQVLTSIAIFTGLYVAIARPLLMMLLTRFVRNC